jgi:hypothetical protein
LEEEQLEEEQKPASRASDEKSPVVSSDPE